LGDNSHDLGANVVKGVEFDNIAVSVKNSVKRNGITSDAINLVVGET
jgi:hypothetical protein